MTLSTKTRLDRIQLSSLMLVLAGILVGGCAAEETEAEDVDLQGAESTSSELSTCTPRVEIGPSSTGNSQIAVFENGVKRTTPSSIGFIRKNGTPTIPVQWTATAARPYYEFGAVYHKTIKLAGYSDVAVSTAFSTRRYVFYLCSGV